MERRYGKYFRSSFYNPKLDGQSKEEKFLLKRRIRLLDKIEKLAGKTDRISLLQLSRWESKLRKTEKYLGLTPRLSS